MKNILSNRRHLGRWLGAVGLCWTLGCTATSHSVVPSPLGQSHAMADLEAAIDVPGTLTVTTINSADWAVDLSGLLNLHHPKAKTAGLEDRIEPIAIYFHAVQHPVRGLFLVDTGIEHKLGTNPSDSAVSWLVRSAMHLERLKVRTDLGTYLAQQKQPVQGVFLTHLHLDHVSGLPDLREDVPVYVGRGDAEDRAFINLFARSTINAELDGKGPLREFIFERGTDVLDVFGDGQFWAMTHQRQHRLRCSHARGTRAHDGRRIAHRMGLEQWRRTRIVLERQAHQCHQFGQIARAFGAPPEDESAFGTSTVDLNDSASGRQARLDVSRPELGLLSSGCGESLAPASQNAADSTISARASPTRLYAAHH